MTQSVNAASVARLVLASASPRRAELLTAAGFAFDVVSITIDETRHPHEPPETYVTRLAAAKAAAVRDRSPEFRERPIIGADTVVVVDERILGKPAGVPEATDMLRILSGRTHRVLTGVAVCLGRHLECACATSDVTFSSLSESEIAWYVGTGEPLDKAGAYAVQGLASRFVERIDGSCSNVVGLPMATVCGLLKQLDWREGPAKAGHYDSRSA